MDHWTEGRKTVKQRGREVSSAALSPLEELVLTVLFKHKLYGLEIIKAVEEASEGKRRLGFGSLYPTLHKLQKKGLLTSQWGEETPEERGGARRRYYQITAAGKNALREMRDVRTKIAAWKPAFGGA
jgi:PadR family transcriptional regulator PadR